MITFGWFWNRKFWWHTVCFFFLYLNTASIIVQSEWTISSCGSDVYRLEKSYVVMLFAVFVEFYSFIQLRMGWLLSITQYLLIPSYFSIFEQYHFLCSLTFAKPLQMALEIGFELQLFDATIYLNLIGFLWNFAIM